MSSRRLNISGFTLLEIMISMSILAFISVLTASSIQSAIKFKAKTITKIEETSYVYDALKIMAEDIRLAYNYKDINIEVFNLAQEERQKRAQQKQKNPNQPPNETGEPDPDSDPAPIQPTAEGITPNTFTKKKENRLTQFIGQRDKINFTSLSYSRTVENSQFSNQAEVGFYVADCRGRLDKRQSTQCLWRRTSPIIDENIEEGGTNQILMESVATLKLRYLNIIEGNEEVDWRQDWMSDDRGDVVTKGKFPFAVEITIETKPDKPDAKPVSMTIVAPISFPNNQMTTEEKANAAVNNPNVETN